MACTGFDGAIGIGTAAATNTALASYTALDSARDANATITADKAELSDRTSEFKNYVSAGLDVEITAELTLGKDDTQLATLRTACLGRTKVLVGLFMDGVAASSQGITFDAYVFSNDIAQPLADGQTVSVTFAPAADGTNVPAWVTLA